jgi:hypothetical protein
MFELGAAIGGSTPRPAWWFASRGTYARNSRRNLRAFTAGSHPVNYSGSALRIGGLDIAVFPK